MYNNNNVVCWGFFYSPPEPTDPYIEQMIALAIMTGSVTANLKMVPNQPIVFKVVLFINFKHSVYFIINPGDQSTCIARLEGLASLQRYTWYCRISALWSVESIVIPKFLFASFLPNINER